MWAVEVEVEANSEEEAKDIADGADKDDDWGQMEFSHTLEADAEEIK